MPLTKNRIREISALARKTVREERGLFVAEGLRLVTDAAASAAEIPEAFATAEFASSEQGARLMEVLRRRGTICTNATDREFAGIADTVNAQGVLALVRAEKVTAEDLMDRLGAPSVVVALDGIADPGNLGSILRTCDWFGTGGVLLGSGSVDLYNPKVVRATMGGIFRVPVAVDLDLPEEALRAKARGYTVFVADQSARVPLAEARFPERTLIALGNEAHGVSAALARIADERISIPRFGSAESLNVGVACGILLAAHRRCYP
jgi:TrmH family RNA methyltransferase